MYSYWAEFERPKVKEELAQVLEAKAADTLSGVLDRMVKMRDEVLERSLDQLRESIDKLTGAQARTDAALQKLAEAQARTEERLDRVEAAIEKLAQAQVRTEERLDRVEAAIEKLAQAQARSEERLDRVEAAIEKLAQAQARTEARVEELAQAQARTDKALEKLARQVGGLSETVGGDIEDIAYIVLHDVLRREFGWQVGVLQRTWKTWNGKIEEINVFGQAVDPAHPERPIWIVGEAKHNISMREVERFARQVERARQHLVGEIFPVCFCYRARPEVQERIKDLGLRPAFSYGRLD